MGMMFLHAGVADHCQRHAVFEHFAKSSRVLRYDQLGFGQSVSVVGEIRSISNLETVLCWALMAPWS